jgi:hypothetical protein
MSTKKPPHECLNLFIDNAKTQKPRCPSVGEWTNAYIHTTEYYLSL